MLPIRTVLHPTDFSRHSEIAFRLACSLARDYGAELYVLHVEPLPVTALGGPMALPPLPEEYGREAMEEKLRALRAENPDIVVAYRFGRGDAATEILRTAEKTHCDLIVMGMHGRTGLNRLIMGSVAEQIVRRATCPVLTVRTPHLQTKPAAEPAKPLGSKPSPEPASSGANAGVSPMCRGSCAHAGHFH